MLTTSTTIKTTCCSDRSRLGNRTLRMIISKTIENYFNLFSSSGNYTDKSNIDIMEPMLLNTVLDVYFKEKY